MEKFPWTFSLDPLLAHISVKSISLQLKLNSLLDIYYFITIWKYTHNTENVCKIKHSKIMH